MRVIPWYLLRFFLFDIHYRYFRLIYRVTVVLAHKFGLQVMIHNLFKPLFGFPGFSTRITGAVFRSAAIIVGTILIIGFIIISISLYPLFVMWMLYMLREYPLMFISVIIGIGTVYAYKLSYFAFIHLEDINDDEWFPYTTDYQARKIISQFLSKNSLAGLKSLEKSEDIIRFHAICEIDHIKIFQYLRKEWNALEQGILRKTLQSYAEAYDLKYASAEMVYVSILKNMPDIQKYLSKHNAEMTFIEHSLYYVEYLRERSPYIWEDDYILKPSGGIDKGWATGYTAVLNQYSTDLTKLALKGYMPQLVGREDTKKNFVNILSKPSRNNILLVGESGCGKTTFVKAMANEIARGTNIPSLRYKRIISLDIGALTSGAPGDMNTRLTLILREIEASGNVIIFVDEIHNLSSTLNADPNAVAAFSTFEPYLSSGKFQFIGATSRDNYVKYIRPNESFTKNFDLVEMPEATYEETTLIIAEVIKELGQKTTPLVTYRAITRAIEYADKYVHTSVLPDKAVELINRGIAKAKNSGEMIVNEDLIAGIISESVGVPVKKLTETDREKLMNLEDTLHMRVIGQNDAISKIVSAIKRSRVQMRDEHKPIASFLFSGPTGVGKTETAKALAASYYGNEKEMIRIDMSEYQDIQSVRRLIGTETGSVGRLTAAVREKPHSLILIDEIEKAHDKIQYLFLQVLDDARLTDAMGNVIDFSNSFVIMTSNVGTRDIIKAIQEKKTQEEIQESSINALKDHFAPEFLNRFTSLVAFNPLTLEEVEQIAEIKLHKVIERMEEKHITVDFTDGVIKQIAKLGYSPEWGARPLNRVIEEKVETKLAEELIQGTIGAGDSIVVDHVD